MKHITYGVVGIIIFLLIEMLVFNLGPTITRSVDAEAYIVTALAMLCSINIMCTYIIVRAIKNINN